MFSYLKKKIFGYFVKSTVYHRSIKMYVIVNDELDYIHQAVQAGHAVAEWFMRHGHEAGSRKLLRSSDGTINEWSNGYMIYLGCSHAALLSLENKLIRGGVKHGSFRECDFGEFPQLTAIAYISYGDELKDYNLLRMPSNSDQIFDKLEVDSI